MKNKIVMFFLKIYYSIVGFFLIRKIMKKDVALIARGDDYVKTILPLGDKKYKVNYQFLERTYGVQYFNERTDIIKYWVIGILYKNKELKISNYKVFYNG